MTISIVGGTGPEGSGLALRWAEAGETIVIGSSDHKRAAQKAVEIRDRLARGGAGPSARVQISGEENSEACSSAEIVVLTIPFQSHADIVKQLKPVLHRGQSLEDATVPLAASIGAVPRARSESGRARLPNRRRSLWGEGRRSSPHFTIWQLICCTRMARSIAM